MDDKLFRDRQLIISEILFDNYGVVNRALRNYFIDFIGSIALECRSVGFLRCQNS